MGITRTGIIDAPLDEVFAWHGRPGAVVRLTPPWLPLRVQSEAASLASGRAVLGLPGGLRWIAEHDPAGYDPPHRFADVLARDGLRSLPLSALLSWRHTHRFEEAGDGGTQVTDRVDTPIPAALLRQTFAYRHRQLDADLRAHRRTAEQGVRPHTVAISGSSGMIGAALAAFLSTGGHRVIRLVRHAPNGPDERRWDPLDPAADLLTGVDAVVHLAGSPIAGWFSERHRRAVRDSRVEPTRLLAKVAAGTADGPHTLITASAVGYYGYGRGDDVLDEGQVRGDGFLADVVADWEAASTVAEEAGLRVVRVRTGIVQSPAGGMLRVLYPIFGAGLGGRLGGGREWMSWIDLDDLVDIYHRAIVDPRLSGAINAVAPEPVRNVDYTRTLGRALSRPAIVPIPGFAPAVLLGGQGAREMALADQRVVPAKLDGLGHAFRYAELENSLRHQLGRVESVS